MIMILFHFFVINFMLNNYKMVMNIEVDQNFIELKFFEKEYIFCIFAH